MTSDAGLALILSAKSVSDAPRRIRTTVRAVPARDLHATDRRGLHLLELLALRALGLASTNRTAATAAERTGRDATAAATADDHRRRDDRRSRHRRHRDRHRATAATGATRRTRTTTGTTRTGRRDGRSPRGRASCPGWDAHHRDAGRRHRAARTRTGCAGASWAGLRDAACPGSGRRGCCPDATSPHGRPPGGPCPGSGRTGCCRAGAAARTRGRTRGATGRAGATRSTRTAGLTGGDARSRGTRTRSGRSRRRGGRPGRGGRGGSGRRLDRGLDGGGGRRGGGRRRGLGADRSGRGVDGAGADGAGADGADGAAVFTAVWAPFPLPCPLAAPRSSAGNVSLMLANDRGFDGRRCRPDELALVLEVRQERLALDSELFGELVDTDLGHVSPSRWSDPEGHCLGRTVVSAGVAHR